MNTLKPLLTPPRSKFWKHQSETKQSIAQWPSQSAKTEPRQMSVRWASPFVSTCVILGLAMFSITLMPEAFGQKYKQLPPPGIEVPESEKQKLQTRLEGIHSRLNAAIKRFDDSALWHPDIRVLTRAIELSLEQGLFFKKSDLDNAHTLLDEAQRRLSAVMKGKRGFEVLGLKNAKTAGQRNEPTLIVRGFVSQIDDSVQPYGLVIPPLFEAQSVDPVRLDVWLHGRGDSKTELQFLSERMQKVGQYSPTDTVVLHPFGRHCNAFKFAGETDVYEAISHVASTLPIDDQRIAIRGFSMGGAGVWHLSVHNPGKWFAANPGAGFVDTVVYQGWDKEPPFELNTTRQSLLRLYDVIPWVENLRNTRLVAYSGEVDRQRQAAERVLTAAADARIDVKHVIGQKMGHKIDEASKLLIDTELANWASETSSPMKEIDYTTFTTKYSKCQWLAVTGLKRHYDPARLRASLKGTNQVIVDTENVTHFSLDFSGYGWPDAKANTSNRNSHSLRLTLDGETFTIDDMDEAEGFQANFVIVGNQWSLDESDETLVRKRPGLQGPIDDAFCSRFLFVRPTRPAIHGEAERFVQREMAYAQKRWRELMRGNVRVVDDVDLTAKQIEENHLVCFGDFISNQFLRRIRNRLPINWTKETLRVGGKRFDPATHVPVFCYPNPANPRRYVVVNSGMTFREFSNVSNSRQIAMLPDWTIFDVTTDDDSIFAAKIVSEGFFDESWQLAP